MKVEGIATTATAVSVLAGGVDGVRAYVRACVRDMAPFFSALRQTSTDGMSPPYPNRVSLPT